MRRLVFLMTALAFAVPLEAQQPRRQMLEQRITEQFFDNYRRQAGLTPEQFNRFRAVAMKSMQQQRERQQREQALRLALEAQMRPGLAANPDSVSKLLDATVAVRAANLDQMKADDRELATFLSPVQRAQLFLARERLQRSMEEMVRRRLQQVGGANGAGGLPPDPEP